MESIARAVAALKLGRPIVVVDNLNRENEGDIVAAAEFATPELVNFMITEGRGLVCAPLTAERAKLLKLHPMVSPTNDVKAPYKCNFTVSVDAAYGITTGISAKDRAETLKLLAAENAHPSDFVRPGHVFPLIATPRGIRHREGHTEATIELLTLAKLTPVGIICEILKPDGTMARRPELTAFTQKHNLPLVFIEDLIAFVKRTTRPVSITMSTTRVRRAVKEQG